MVINYVRLLPNNNASYIDQTLFSIVEVLQILIELESEYGALPSQTPVIDGIIAFTKVTLWPKSYIWVWLYQQGTLLKVANSFPDTSLCFRCKITRKIDFTSQYGWK